MPSPTSSGYDSFGLRAIHARSLRRLLAAKVSALGEVPMQAPVCKRCNRSSRWHKQPTGRGWRILPWCARCDHHPTSWGTLQKGHKTWFAIDLFDAAAVESMPIRDGWESHCAVCGHKGPTEQHHLAPRALFVNANLWPVVEVCAACHDEWHAKVWRA